MTPRDLAELLLDKARRDLRAAIVLAGDSEVADEAVGFHAQQAVEKALKAVLTGAGVRAGRTHDLARLVELLAEARIEAPDWLAETESLASFAVTFRYAELEEDEPLDRAATISLVEQAVEWTADQLREIG